MKRWFALLALLMPAVAQGQSSGFALDRFDPAPRGSDFFVLDSLDFRGTVRGAAGFTLDFGYKPLVVQNPDGTEQSAIVKDQLFAHAGGTLILFDRLRLNVNVPVAIFQQGDTSPNVTLQPPSQAALGDPRAGLDVRLVGTYGDPFTLALGGSVWIPVGNQDQYAGQGSVRVQPHLLISGQAAGMLEYAAFLGWTYLPDLNVGGTHLGEEFNVGGGIGLRPVSELILSAELYGSTTNNHYFEKTTTPLEVDIGAHLQVGDFKLGLGGGPGLTQGVGTPAFRALFSFEWAPRYVPPVYDRDADGVPDDQDACPDQKGIHTSDPATNGCPDRDGDGIVDAQDACPDKPGVKSADPKKNGCPLPPPPPPDRDHDGILDRDDACPDVAGVPSNDPKKNGCPRDIDSDGIPDTQDACPDVPGVKTNDPATNGCPSDRDKDGIPDNLDACPDQPGIPELHGCPDKDTDNDGVPDRLDNCPTVPGPKENGGCPPKQKQLVVITREKLEIKDKIYFATNKATIQRKSFKLLDQIATVIKGHPNIEKIRIEGHTDNVGSAEHNRKLSQARADSVKAYLVKKGVNADRLESVGYGPDRPIDTNKTAKGRANNRRVEFVIVPGAGQTTTTPGTPAPAPATPPVHP